MLQNAFREKCLMKLQGCFSQELNLKGIFFLRFYFQVNIPFKLEIKLANIYFQLIHIF